MDLWRYEQYRIGIQRFDWRMGFTCFGGHGAAAQVCGADWYALAAGPGRLG